VEVWRYLAGVVAHGEGVLGSEVDVVFLGGFVVGVELLQQGLSSTYGH
jgi:hypothetical protein